MRDSAVALVAVLFFFAAVIYSSVGHAGASAYLAVMALAAPPAIMRPTAFVLNIVVASLVAFRFIRNGYFSWQGWLPSVLIGSLIGSQLGLQRLNASALQKMPAAILVIAGFKLLLGGG